MKLHIRADGRTLRHHFSYHWWQYALIIVLSVFIWNLIYIQTAYRAPGERRIDLYVQTLTADSDQLENGLRAIGKEAVPEAEEINLIAMLPPSAQDMYANIQLVTFMSAREGDIYVLGPEEFKRFASQGAFMALDEALADGRLSLRADAEAMKSGYVTVIEVQEDGTEKPLTQSHLYGIPLKAFPAAAERLGLYRGDMFLSVTRYTDNPDSTLAFIDALLKK